MPPFCLPEKAPYWKPNTIASARELGRYMVLGCGDDRWQWGGIQFFGGNVGLAMGWAGAMEIAKPNSFDKATKSLAKPVDTMAKMIHHVLRGKDTQVLALNHEGCAGFEAMGRIALTGVDHAKRFKHPKRSAAQEREMALQIAQTISPEMTAERFDETSAALARVALKGLRSTKVAANAMKPSGEYEWVQSDSGLAIPASRKGITRVPLNLPAHEASLVAVTGDPYHTFDSMQAWGQDKKAYHVSLGYLPEVHSLISPYMGDPGYQNFKDAMTVYTAKTVLNLPMPGMPGENLGPTNVQFLPTVKSTLGLAA